MKKILSIALMVLGLTLQAYGQSPSKAEQLETEKKIVKLARQVGDLGVVSNSFYRIIALEGETSTYKDSLAYFYFSSRQYAPSFMMAEETLKREPEHLDMLEIKAVSLEALGALDKSAEVYAQLFELTQVNFYGYNLAKLQLTMKKNEEAYATIKKVEGLNDTGEFNINFVINQNHTQSVELMAAIPYLKGLIEQELEKNAEAKISFEKAVKVQPDFVLAKEKLESL